MTWTWLIIANLAVLWMRRYRNRPFRTEHAGIELTIDPATKNVRCHTTPNEQQLKAISTFVQDWPAVLKTRPYVSF